MSFENMLLHVLLWRSKPLSPVTRRVILEEWSDLGGYATWTLALAAGRPGEESPFPGPSCFRAWGLSQAHVEVFLLSLPTSKLPGTFASGSFLSHIE